MEKLPPKSGIMLQPEQLQQRLDGSLNFSWLAIQPEDFLAMGGESHYFLEKVSSQFPISLLANGLSIGSAESVNEKHLQNIKSLCDRYSPCHVSTPLSWCRWQGVYLGTSLPIPLTVESLDQVTFNLRTVQNALGRRILVTNSAQYLNFNCEQIPESVFFEELVRNSGCGMVLDLTSLYATALNNQVDPFKLLNDYPLAAVKEIHLSGHQLTRLNDEQVMVIADDPSPIAKPLWQLYRETLSLLPRPMATLIKCGPVQGDTSLINEEVDKADLLLDTAADPRGLTQ